MADKPPEMYATLIKAMPVGVHKSLAITAHIPIELALTFFGKFGYPTMADPIPVTIKLVQDENPE